MPLKEAHVSGARAWTSSKRRRFANDPDNLLAVETGEGMSKGSRGPSECLPKIGRCRYVERWVTVKRAWDLRMNTDKRATVDQLLGDCR